MQLTLGERLRLERKRAGLTQEELSIKAKVSRNSIAMIERNEYNPTLGQLIKIFDILGFFVEVDIKPRDRNTDVE